MNNNARILILGGTGFVGRHVCEQLARLGVYMTVPTRRAANAAQVQSLPRLTVVEADIHDPAHVQLARTIARACTHAGVRRLVHVSALGAAPEAPSQYLRSKAGGEAVLHSAGLDLTVLRPSVIFGAEDKFMNVFAQLQAVFPVIPLAGAETRFQPVWVGDVAQAVVHCLQDFHTVDQTYELCGPEVFTLAQLVHNAGRWAGVNHGQGRTVFGIPYVLGWLQAALMELAPGQPLMSRDNLRSMKVDNVATEQQPGLQALHIQPASLAGVAPGYLGARGPRSALNRLREAAGRQASR